MRNLLNSRLVRGLCVALAGLGAVSTARAASLGVNFVGAGSAITDSGGAFGVPLANWNNLSGASGTSIISPSSGGAITVTWATGGGEWQSGATFGGFSAGENQVFSGNLYAGQNDPGGAGAITITISDMDAIATGDYTLRLMAGIDGSGATARFREAVIMGGPSIFFDTPTVSGTAVAAATTNHTMSGNSFTFTIANDNVTEGGIRWRAEISGLTLSFTPVLGPMVTTHPQSQTVLDGTDATFTVAATGAEPLTYQWLFNGADIPFETRTRLTVLGATSASAGSYRCRATDANSRFALSSSATLVVAPAGMVLAYDPATITSAGAEAYSGGMANFFDVVAGTSIVVTDLGTALDEATAGSPLTVQLYNVAGPTVLATVTFDGTDVSTPVASTPALNLLLKPLPSPLTLGPGSYAIAIYGNSAAARVPRTPADVSVNGALLHIGSRYGNGEGPGVLPGEVDGAGITYLAGTFKMTVSGAPVITQQPQGGPFAAGATVNLSVGAGGSLPLTYQWSKDGNPMAGATNATLTLNNITFLAAGSYTVKITNTINSVTSLAAVVIVAGAPTVNINLHAGIALQGTVGIHYRVEYRTDLDPPHTWTLLQDVPSLPSATFMVYDPTPATQPKRIYQAVQAPEPRF